MNLTVSRPPWGCYLSGPFLCNDPVQLSSGHPTCCGRSPGPHLTSAHTMSFRARGYVFISSEQLWAREVMALPISSWIKWLPNPALAEIVADHSELSAESSLLLGSFCCRRGFYSTWLFPQGVLCLALHGVRGQILILQDYVHPFPVRITHA